MELVTFAQEQPPAIKWLATITLIVLAGILIAVLWQKPNRKAAQPDSHRASAPPTMQAGNGNLNFVGNNNGVIAGSYVSPSPAQEELARQQLADLHERRVQERRAADEAAAKAKKDTADKARAEEVNRASGLVDRLRGEYITSRDGISSAMLAGTEPVPDEWMNGRLRALGVRYVYHGNPGGSYTLAPIP